MDIKPHLKTIIISIIVVALAILMIVFYNTADRPQPTHQTSSMSKDVDSHQEIDEWDENKDEEVDEKDDFENENVTDHEEANAGEVLNNHFVALAKGDREMLRNTVDDVVTSYIGMSNATPADIEKYMQSLHANGSSELSYMIRHLIVNKDVDGGFYTVNFSLTQIIRQGEKTIEHTFTGRSEINRESKITALILSQQS